MTDNIWEEVAYWQEYEELQNLKAIEEHELETLTPEQLGSLFNRTVKKRRQDNE